MSVNDFNHNGRIGGGIITMPSWHDINRLEARVAELERQLAAIAAVVGGEEWKP